MWILIYSFSDTYYVWAACGDIGVKIDCHMKPYADKLFVVLYFSVRSSRSSAQGRHFANIPWGRELGFYSARWVRKARKMETSRGHSALTDGSWESFLSSLLHERRWNMKMKQWKYECHILELPSFRWLQKLRFELRWYFLHLFLTMIIRGTQRLFFSVK